MKNYLIIILSLAMFTACSQEQEQRPSSTNKSQMTQPIPVSIHSGYTLPALLEQSVQVVQLETLADVLTQKWYAEFSVFDTAQPDQTFSLSTCQNYLPQQAKQLNTRQENENTAFMEITVMCAATDKILHAQPAKVSFVKDLPFDESLPNKAPVAVAMILSSNERDKILSDNNNKTWSQAAHIIGYENLGAYHAVYKAEGGIQELELVARGDFNRDGFEDLMLTSRDYVTEGNYSAIRLFILTRTILDGPIQLVQ